MENATLSLFPVSFRGNKHGGDKEHTLLKMRDEPRTAHPSSIKNGLFPSKQYRPRCGRKLETRGRN